MTAEAKALDDYSGAENRADSSAVRRLSRARPPVLKLTLSVGAAAAVFVAAWYFVAGQKELRVDSAFVVGHVLQLTSPVDGVVDVVRLEPRQAIAQGSVALVLNELERKLAVEQATTRLRLAVRIEVQQCLEQALWAVRAQSAVADREHKRLRLERTAQLAERQIVSAEGFGDARHDFEQAGLQERAAQLELQRLEFDARPAPAERGPVAEALGTLRTALTERTRSAVTVPVNGYVHDVLVHRGQAVQQGAVLAVVVPHEPLVVQANVLESQREFLRVGQSARVRFDAYPPLADLEGHVIAVAPATASEFSPLPRFNIDSTWIKVSQRIPVFIGIDQDLSPEMRPPHGSSAEVRLQRRADLATQPTPLPEARPQVPSVGDPVTQELQAVLDQVLLTELGGVSDDSKCMERLRGKTWKVN
jgi:membrane fusion protein, multidrug efflux system